MYSWKHIALFLVDLDVLVLGISLFLIIAFRMAKRNGEEVSTVDTVIKAIIGIVILVVFIGYNGMTVYCALQPRLVCEPLIYKKSTNSRIIVSETNYDFYDLKGNDVELSVLTRYHDDIFGNLKLEKGGTYIVTFDDRFLYDIISIRETDDRLEDVQFSEVVTVNDKNEYLVDPGDQKFGFILPIILAFGMIFFAMFDSEGHLIKGPQITRRVACLMAFVFFVWLSCEQYQNYRFPVLTTTKMTFEQAEIHDGPRYLYTNYYFLSDEEEYVLYIPFIIEPDDEVIRSRVGNEGLIKGHQYSVTYEESTMDLYDVRTLTD